MGLENAGEWKEFRIGETVQRDYIMWKGHGKKARKADKYKDRKNWWRDAERKKRCSTDEPRHRTLSEVKVVSSDISREDSTVFKFI